MRAREPDSDGFVDRDGVRVYYEVFGSGEQTILALPAWTIVHARQWKAQAPFLSRHFRVIVVDGRGNGRCDRPTTPGAYLDREFVGDAVAVLDAVGVDRVVAIGLSLGARHALQLAAWHPERVLGVLAVAPALPFPIGSADFEVEREGYDGWEKLNRNYWLADYPGFVEFFMSQVFVEPHSTKQREDGVGWGLETDAHTMLLTLDGVDEPTLADVTTTCAAVRCPVLVVHGDQDAIVPYERGSAIAEHTGADLIRIAGGGHNPLARDPVRMNLLIRDFVDRLTDRAPTHTVWSRPLDRRPRALFVSSPIGLGHTRRDAAIADELRVLRPDLQIEWLVQDPVAGVLAARGERVHPASYDLAGEAAHIDSEAGEHDLHAFQAIRRMDEILVANFHVFNELADAATFDLVIADEGWDVDYFLHENPELKRSPFAWLTDFVGWLPMPDGGEAEAALTGDYNAEMVEQIARYPRLRDRSIFVGDPEDLVTDPLGPGLPSVRDWTTGHFDFAGYVTGLSVAPDRDALRAELGYRPDQRVCVVTVGGSGVGGHLLRRVVAAYPQLLRAVPGLRMVAVAGPRIDPATIAAPAGVQVHGYVPDLYRHLAACDIAIVQGGLTTTMELVAHGRPFLYFPLGHHFEQQFHVPHRLRRHRAGRRMDYATLTPDVLAAAVVAELDRPVDYLPVPADGARRAATMLAALL